MAFNSETTLKFGSSYISFAVITLLDYSLVNEKVGAFDYRRKENISLAGLFSNRESSIPISEHFRQVKLLIENSTDFVEVYLNDKPYGKARFLGFSFPSSVSFDENSIRFSKIEIKLEILKDDSSNDFSDVNLPSSISNLSTIWYKLKNFTESFSFNVAQDNAFSASHNISFELDNIDKNTDSEVVILANQVANKFFAQSLDILSSIRPFYSSTDFQISALDYGSSLKNQTIDLINYSFSYSKEYEVFSSNESASSETIFTEINYGANGIIEVVERGRVKGKGADYATARSNAISRLDYDINTAYTRCNSAFNRYISNNYGDFSKFLPKYDSADSLGSYPVSITKDLSEFGPEVGYEIKFSTDKSYGATRIHSYNISLAKTPQGIYESVVDGSIKYYTNKNKSFNLKISDIKSIIDTDDNSIINPYFLKVAGSGTFGGIRTSSSLKHLKFGVETTYSKSYSNSPSLIPDAPGNIIRQVLISENLIEPINKYSTVVIPGYDARAKSNSISIRGKETIYQTRQLSEGVKNITIEMKVDRSRIYSGVGDNLVSATVFSTIKDLFITHMMNKTQGYLFGSNGPKYAIIAFSKIYNELSIAPNILTWFLEDLRISFDSSYGLRANLVFKFLVNKEVL